MENKPPQPFSQLGWGIKFSGNQRILIDGTPALHAAFKRPSGT
jgi:hypothetical protein